MWTRRRGTIPDEFHGVKISSVEEERLKWPGLVELSVKKVFDLKKFKDGHIFNSNDTKLVLEYDDPKAASTVWASLVFRRLLKSHTLSLSTVGEHHRQRTQSM